MGIEMHIRRLILPLVLAACLAAKEKKARTVEPSPLDQYIENALGRQPGAPTQASTGSLWSPVSRLTDLGSDLRATQVDDLVTIVVAEQASAVANGATKTQRQSTLSSTIPKLAGVTNPTGALANLANLSTQSQLNGQGATSRSTQLSTTLSARITHVLPNGYLVVEGSKDVVVNSEHQVVTIRGVVRPYDLSTGNEVSSNRVAQMELKINGKGVVNDAVRRPFILYRLLMGLLPF